MSTSSCVWPRLYPILDASFGAAWPVAPAVGSLARAGCRIIQLRGKELSGRDFYLWSREAVAAAKPSGVSMIINDRADVALAAGASGVHLGQEDLSVEAVRRILPPPGIVGISTHTLEQARRANELPVDYVAIGPVFSTPTKKSEYPGLGPKGVERVRAVVGKPLIAIGGITLDNGRSVIAAGADSLAVISALMSAEDLEATARSMLEKWE